MQSPSWSARGYCESSERRAKGLTGGRYTMAYGGSSLSMAWRLSSVP